MTKHPMRTLLDLMETFVPPEPPKSDAVPGTPGFTPPAPPTAGPTRPAQGARPPAPAPAQPSRQPDPDIPKVIIDPSVDAADRAQFIADVKHVKSSFNAHNPNMVPLLDCDLMLWQKFKPASFYEPEPDDRHRIDPRDQTHRLEPGGERTHQYADEPTTYKEPTGGGYGDDIHRITEGRTILHEHVMEGGRYDPQHDTILIHPSAKFGGSYSRIILFYYAERFLVRQRKTKPDPKDTGWGNTPYNALMRHEVEPSHKAGETRPDEYLPSDFARKDALTYWCESFAMYFRSELARLPYVRDWVHDCLVKFSPSCDMKRSGRQADIEPGQPLPTRNF